MTHTSPPTLAEIRERDRQELATYNSNALRQQMPPIECWSVPASIDRRALLRLLDESHAQIDGLMKRLLREEATLRILSDTSHFKDMDAMAEFARIAMASQGGGDG